jgi:polysaccharide deacetylase 2 family uncharacterized protein YibQ
VKAPEPPQAGADPGSPGPRQAEKPPTVAAGTEQALPPTKPGATAEPQTVTIIDGISGKREQVTIGGTGAAKNANEPAKAAAGTTDQRLFEKSRHGEIPRIGADGARPADVYARSIPPAAGPGPGPRIAIVVGRLGISASGTSEAMAKLPPSVTLAYVAHATDVERWVSRARSEGREVLLQVPMEPFDYPDNDPGPQTLLAALTSEQNIDRLHWFMSRARGYVGVANYMGARFVSNEPAVAPVLGDIGKRGLLFFDDGVSARSVTGQVASAHNLPFAKADIVIDAAPTVGEIDAALAKLENIARERGTAVGSATALPVSVDRIARWAKAAASRGVVLVPVSAVVNKPKSS